ncbi:DUF2339 domain-containing protein [Nocardia brasiliensis]|nr:DUF2339 domain-containing protein [Nocardia brasiliensis]
MTTSIDPALISRLSGEFAALGTQMGVLGRDLELLRIQVVTGSAGAHGVSALEGGRAEGSVPGTAVDLGAGQVPPALAGPTLRVGSQETSSGALGTEVPGQATGSGPQAQDSGAGFASGAATGPRPHGSDAVSGAGSAPDEAATHGANAAATPATGVQGSAAAPGTGTDVPSASSGAPGAPTTAGAVPMGQVPGVGGSPQGVPAAGIVAPQGMHGPGTAPLPNEAAWAAVSSGAVRPPYPPMFAPQGGPGWAARPPMPGRGMPGPGMRPPVPPRAAPPVPHTPWWQRDGLISKLLAVAGVGVTLIGVVMLLVLAAQAGFFGPIPRVVAGAAFSATLVAAGMRVFDRPGGRVGGIALAATGIAGAYLDVVAVTAIYHWLHPVLGFAVALGVAAIGVALALRWQSQPLAVLVVVGAAALSPVLTTELVLLAFLIVLQVACLPVQLVRDWPYLHVVRTLPAGLATFLVVAGALLDTPDDRLRLLVAAVAVAAVGLAGTVLVVRQRPSDVTASLTLALVSVPLLIAPGMYRGDRPVATAIAAVFAAVLLLVAATALVPKVAALVRLPGHTCTVAAVAGAVALLEVCVVVTDARTLPIAWLLVALGFFGVAGQRRSGVAAGLGAAFAVLGGLAFLNVASPEILASQHRSEQSLTVATALAALLLMAVVAVALWCARTVPGLRNTAELQWIVAGLAGLYAVTTAAVSIAVATGADDGFLIGHSAATILWMAGATASLFYGLRNLGKASAVAKLALGSGLLVTAAALAKLFLFDLATLDGLVRVAAFLVVGVLLLVVGTRYARAFAEAE